MKKWLDKYEAPKAQVGTMLAPITGEDVSKFFDMFSVPQKAVTKMVTGKYQTPSEAMNIKNPVGAFATDMILDPTNLVGAGVAARQAIKFKPKPGMMYRGLGEEGYKDAIESGVFRPKQHGYAESRSLAEKVTTPKQFGSTFYAPADNFSVVKNYGGKYVAEVPFDEATFSRRYGRKDWSWSTRKQIPINEGRILQKDWLRGYKEVKKPKKKAQNGIEGTMGGLTDVGFNYNGAWGGTMKMGGSIPGAVGFTYARTINPAPDNGPGAKKTKASAQDGMEMKFYQEGLDFKPKTISQDGTYVKKPRTDMLTMDEYRLQQALANQPVVQPALKTGQLSAEEIKRRNKAYAQQTGKKFDEKTGKVSPRFSPQQEKTLKKIQENIVEPALTIGDVMAGAALTKPLTKALGKKALSTFVDPDRLPNVARNVRINTLDEFNDRTFEWARNAGIDVDDFRGNVLERFKDIKTRYGLDPNNPSVTAQLRNFPEATKSEFLTEMYRSFPQRLRRSDFVPTSRSFFTRGVEIEADQITIPRGLTNRSGLTKQQVLEKAPVKDKDIVSKMTDEEFKETVVKPTGEVVPYYTGDLMPQFTGKQNVMAISADEYARRFNEKIETLNEIIAKNNKSGFQYRVKELSPSGRLTFETPAQVGVPDEALPPPPGETYWTTNINPGTWEGEVEDIASSTYYKSIPGLSMSSSSAGVFPDRTPRRGTAAYESINEYLKQLNLGRVKPGFNSQTDYSRGLWETAVNKGKAFGYYNNPRVVYGSMKSLLPYAGLGGLGAAALEQKREGGEITVDPMGYWNPDNVGEPVIIPSNVITMEGVDQPLIGISDTGDVQYMEPGEDYEFDGEYVTEYPVAKNGVSVNNADAQPLKKLDQLLNFTNYNKPTKGGWLDKYN